MKTVKKTLDILEVFLNGGKEISVNELADITGQNVSTVHSILLELSKMGYIRQRQKRGKYSLGLKFLSFGRAINSILGIEEIFHPFMVDLSNKVNETVNLAVRDGNYTYSIAVIESTQRLRVVTNRQYGGRIPLYCTGIGKVFLADMPDEELRTYLEHEPLNPITANTITDPKKLLEQIQKVRRDGLAFDIEECEFGVRNVAGPAKDYTGKVVAAIGVLGPSVRLTLKRIKEISPIVKKCAVDISHELQWSGDKKVAGLKM